ncbi:carboxypeptidase-like regulatory domain-containing protein [Myxococcus stipitatus]|uniref:MSCRAMM family protein n=1 Tax=Myxococcus stipitatus TaxID=83455 RepID=UPI003144FBAD
MRKWLPYGLMFLGAVSATLWLGTRAPDAPPSNVTPRRNDRLATHFVPTPPPHGTLTLQGRVLREDQTPVAGVEVSASWSAPGESLSARPCGENPRMPLTFLYCTGTADAQPIPRLIAEGRGSTPVLGRTTTATDGAFSLEGLPAGSVALWVLSAEGVALSLDVATGQRNVTLVLAPGVSAQGRVVDERMLPVANAQVTLFNVDHSRYFEAFTDAEGRFTLERLPHDDPCGCTTGFSGRTIGGPSLRTAANRGLPGGPRRAARLGPRGCLVAAAADARRR